MDSGELIELFYNRTYEKFVNKQILDDKNFIVPRQQLTNYVHELVHIPFIDFVDYIKHNELVRIIEPSDITQFSSFPTCEMEMCKALLWANNPGCQYADIGRLFPNELISRSESAYKRFGEIHIKTSTQLGLTFEYYNYWYLSCLGYIYPELEKNLRMQLLARTITRNRLYQQLLIDILEHDINPEMYISGLTNYNYKRCKRSVCYFLNICLEICRKDGIKVYNLIKRYETPQKRIQDYNPLKANERMDKYLMEIDRQELLLGEEEVELAIKIRKGEIDARNRLVNANLRFVLETAKQYFHKGLNFEDLLNEGFYGLIIAAEHFDETRGYRFVNYAQWWIRRYIINAIVTDSSLIRFPLNVQILHKRITVFKDKFEHQYGFMPPVSEIDDEDDLETISFLDNLPKDLKDTCISYEDLDVFEDNHNIILDYEEIEYNSYYVGSLLTHLSKREREILIRIFGIGVREETLESIGDTFGLTRERVRQIKEKAIRKLREIINMSNKNEQDDHEDEEAKEMELTIGEIERKESVHRILKSVVKSKRESSDNHQKGQYRIVNKDKTFEIRGENNNLLFNSKGYVLSINGDLFCIRFHYIFFKIYLLKVTGDTFKVGELIIQAPKKSHLYQLLIVNKYEIIEDVKQDYSNKEYKVFADGKWYDNSGYLIIERVKKSPWECDILQNNKGDHNNVSPGLREVDELDGVKIGSKIVYDGKECTICKILIRDDSSRFLVKYYNEILDYVPNNKSLYHKALPQCNSRYGETNVGLNNHSEVKQLRNKKSINLSYNCREFRWNVGDFVTLGLMFRSPITIQGDPYFLFRRNVIFVFMKSRTANKNTLNSKIYLLPTDTQIFRKSFSEKYGRRTPRIIFFIYESLTVVQFLDEVKIQRIDTNFIRFESLL